MTRARWLLTALAALAALAVFGAVAGPALFKPTRVAAERQVVPNGIACLGQIDLDGGTANLSPDQPGRVIEVLAIEGESVAAGDVLLRLDPRPARFAADQTEAALTAAKVRAALAKQSLQQHPARMLQQQAAVAATRYRLAGAKHQLARQQELRSANSVSGRDVDAAQEQVSDLTELVRAGEAKLLELSAVDPALPLREAEGEVAAAEARLGQARYALELCDLKAPEAGTVLRLRAHKGELIGGPGTPPAVQFAPRRPWIVRAEVEQEFAARLKPGQPARIADEADPKLTANGKLTRIAGWYAPRRDRADKASQFQDVPTVECVIALDEGHPTFRLGQRVVVTLGP